MQTTKIEGEYKGFKSYHRWLDWGNAGAATAFLTPALFWEAPMVSLSLLGAQSVAALYGYAANRRYDALRGESLIISPPSKYDDASYQRLIISRYIKRNKKNYKIYQMIPAVLFNKEVKANGQVRKLDDYGSKTIDHTVVKRRQILFVETTEHSTLALWDKARKNALKMS